MDKKSSLTQMKPLSYADQSTNERGYSKCRDFNTNLERLALPKESS